MTDRTTAVDVENKIELPWPNESGLVCDKNQTRQRHDQLYRSCLRRNRNSTIGTYSTGCGLCRKETKLSWLIGPSAIYDEKHIKQWRDRSSKCSLRRKQYWTIMIDQIECQLWQSQIGQLHDLSYKRCLRQKWDWVAWQIGLGMIYDENQIGQLRD